jgi:hypothetical protein
VAPIKAAVLGLGRSFLVESFLAPFDREAVRALLRGAVEWKVTDPNMTPQEQQAMRSLVGRHRS